MFQSGGPQMPNKICFSVPTRGEMRTASLAAFAFCVASHLVSPHAEKHGQLRVADPTRLRRFAPHVDPTREVQEQPRKLNPVVRRFAPCCSTLSQWRTSSRLSLAGYAISVTSDAMSPKEQGCRGLPAGVCNQPPQLGTCILWNNVQAEEFNI